MINRLLKILLGMWKSLLIFIIMIILLRLSSHLVTSNKNILTILLIKSSLILLALCLFSSSLQKIKKSNKLLKERYLSLLEAGEVTLSEFWKLREKIKGTFFSKIKSSFYTLIVKNRLWTFVVAIIFSMIFFCIFMDYSGIEYKIKYIPETFFAFVVSAPVALVLWIFRDYDRREANLPIRSKVVYLNFRDKCKKYIHDIQKRKSQLKESKEQKKIILYCFL